MKSTATTLLATVKLARLNASFRGDWRRWMDSASAVPATIESSTTNGGAKKNPTTSGSSLSENDCASRRNWMWTTNTSAAAKNGMSTHQGIWPGAGMGCRRGDDLDQQERPPTPRARSSARGRGAPACSKFPDPRRVPTRGPPPRWSCPNPRADRADLNSPCQCCCQAVAGLSAAFASSVARPAPSTSRTEAARPSSSRRRTSSSRTRKRRSTRLPTTTRRTRMRPTTKPRTRTRPDHEAPDHEAPYGHIDPPEYPPVEVCHVCATLFGSGVGALSTALRSSSPLPIRSCGPFIQWVLSTRSALTWSGVSVGRWLKSSAAAPDTIAAACDVPLPRKKRPSTVAAAPKESSMKESGSRSETMCVPGAARSGLRVPSPSLVKDAG